MSEPAHSPVTFKRAAYERNHRRLGLKPFHLATTREVEEGVNCTGCQVRWEGRPKVRVLLARHDCPTHGVQR